MPRRPRPLLPLPLRPPAEVQTAVAIERADQFLDESRKLIGLLPWFLEAATKAALAAAPRYVGLGDLELLDTHTWRKRGLDPSGGMALWLAEARIVFLCAFHDVAAIDEYFGSILRHQGAHRVDREGSLRIGLTSTNEVVGAFGIVGQFVWASKVSTIEAARAIGEWVEASNTPSSPGNTDADAAQIKPNGESSGVTLSPHARLLDRLRGPAHALRIVISDASGPMGISLTPEDHELIVAFEAPASNEAIQPLKPFCQPIASAARSHGAAMQRGALVVLSGIELGAVVRELRALHTPDEAVDSDTTRDTSGAPIPQNTRPAADMQGVGVLAVHEVDAGLAHKLGAAKSLEDVLGSGMLHASFWLPSNDIDRWKSWVADEVTRERGQVVGVGAAASYLLPIDPHTDTAATAHVRFGFEADTLVGALSDADLREARRAARSSNEELRASILDPEARMLLDRGEPFLYVQIAALADRFRGLAESLWKEGNVGKSFGAREALQVLGRIEDTTLHVRLEADETLRGWCKLRLR